MSLCALSHNCELGTYFSANSWKFELHSGLFLKTHRQLYLKRPSLSMHRSWACWVVQVWIWRLDLFCWCASHLELVALKTCFSLCYLSSWLKGIDNLTSQSMMKTAISCMSNVFAAFQLSFEQHCSESQFLVWWIQPIFTLNNNACCAGTDMRISLHACHLVTEEYKSTATRHCPAWILSYTFGCCIEFKACFRKAPFGFESFCQCGHFPHVSEQWCCHTKSIMCQHSSHRAYQIRMCWLAVNSCILDGAGASTKTYYHLKWCRFMPRWYVCLADDIKDTFKFKAYQTSIRDMHVCLFGSSLSDTSTLQKQLQIHFWQILCETPPLITRSLSRPSNWPVWAIFSNLWITLEC